MMPEEVTPEDIRQIYAKEETEIMTKILLSSIDKINEILKKRYEEIISSSWVRISVKDLDWPSPSSRWHHIADHLSKFYTSWTVELKWTQHEYMLYFTAREVINKRVEIDMSTIKKTEIIAPDEEVSNRADILDL